MKYEISQRNGAVLHVVQRNCGPDYPFSFETIDLTRSEDGISELESYSRVLQASLDMENGPLMKSVLFRLNDGDRLLIILHHLIHDAVSWRILIEDIVSAYTQYLRDKSVTLPLKTDSFKQWAEQIQLYSTSEQLLNQKAYWRTIESASPPGLPFDYESEEGLFRDTALAKFVLSRKETDALLMKAGTGFGAHTDEILLTALAYSMKQWHGHDTTLITLEGHGREPVIKGADVSRTVGWFTSTYPVILNSPDSEDPVQQVEAIKEVIRRIPDRGMGYGILKYITPDEYKKDLTFHLTPEINFNYLGQFDDHDSGLFEFAEESPGESVSPNAKIIHNLDFNVIIEDRKLQLYLRYNAKRYTADTIDKILVDYRDKLMDYTRT